MVFENKNNQLSVQVASYLRVLYKPAHHRDAEMDGYCYLGEGSSGLLRFSNRFNVSTAIFSQNYLMFVKYLDPRISL